MTRVLPEPAPARISSGPSVCCDRFPLSWIECGEKFERHVPVVSRIASSGSALPSRFERLHMDDTRFSYNQESMARTLFQKVWDLHTVRTLPNGQTQLYIGLHLVHEVTSPQAFAELRERGWPVRAPGTHVRDGRSHRADERAGAALRRRDGREHDGRARAELPRARHPVVRPGQRPPGHRPRHRSGARAHAARHDDRVRRQPHVHTRRVRRDRVRHRHVAGARRARVADVWRWRR